MSQLPTCALSDCNERPEVYVKSDSWGYPRVKKLCEEHAEWAEGADNFEKIGDGKTRFAALQKNTE